MHRVRVEEWTALGEDTFHELRSNSPAGGWFPALRELSWTITRSNLPYADLFLFPHLEKVSIYMSWSWFGPGIPHDILPTIASTISTLPTSALQSLLVCVDHRRVSWPYLKDSLSSVILRCGPSLTELNSPVPLSDAAINHLIQLPHFRRWCTESQPPSYHALSSPRILSPLADLTLQGNALSGWFPLFERLEHRDAKAATPLSRMKKSLRFLSVEDLTGSIIDVSFTSTIQIFRNLITLHVGTRCYNQGEKGQCTFKLNNNDITKLAMALSQMESLILGYPCDKNTCDTTAACLLPISASWVKLHNLEIHFNTTNIVDDLKNMLEDPRSQGLLSLPRCTLTRLDVYHTPLTLDEPGLDTVARGLINIFPSLECCTTELYPVWNKISERMVKHRGM